MRVITNKQREGGIQKRMFDYDFVFVVAHNIANKYFPKEDDYIFLGKEESQALAKRICINAIMRGIDMKKLEKFAREAFTVEMFNNYIRKHFGAKPTEETNARIMIGIKKEEKIVLTKIFGLSEEEINKLATGQMTIEELNDLYQRLKIAAKKFEGLKIYDRNAREIIVRFISRRFGLDDGVPKTMHEMRKEVGISFEDKISNILKEAYALLLNGK